MYNTRHSLDPLPFKNMARNCKKSVEKLRKNLVIVKELSYFLANNFNITLFKESEPQQAYLHSKNKKKL